MRAHRAQYSELRPCRRRPGPTHLYSGDRDGSHSGAAQSRRQHSTHEFF